MSSRAGRAPVGKLLHREAAKGEQKKTLLTGLIVWFQVVEKRREYMSSSHDESSLSLSLHKPISPAMRNARTPASSERRRPALNRTTEKPRSIFESSGCVLVKNAPNHLPYSWKRTSLAFLTESGFQFSCSFRSDVEADRSMASDITSTTVVISKAEPEK